MTGDKAIASNDCQNPSAALRLRAGREEVVLKCSLLFRGLTLTPFEVDGHAMEWTWKTWQTGREDLAETACLQQGCHRQVPRDCWRQDQLAASNQVRQLVGNVHRGAEVIQVPIQCCRHCWTTMDPDAQSQALGDLLTR